MDLITTTCTYPWPIAPFASRSRKGFKHCGKPATMNADVPYDTPDGGIELRRQILCLKHATEASVFKMLKWGKVQIGRGYNADEFKILQEKCGLQGPMRTTV